jgi:hypothetical protein
MPEHRVAAFNFRRKYEHGREKDTKKAAPEKGTRTWALTDDDTRNFVRF